MGFQITLRAARVNRGLTLKDAGELIGKCPETISKYEADSTSIPRDILCQLVDVYGVPQDIIFFGKESVFTGLSKSKVGRVAS